MLKRALLQMADNFPKSALVQGKEACEQGHVLTIRLSDGLLKARVMGSTHQIYDVYLDFKSWPKIPARCTCQERGNCKHLAASLFALQAKEALDIIPAFQDKFRVKPIYEQRHIAQDLPDKLIYSDEVTWYSESHVEGETNDFFSYQLGIIIDDKPVSIVPWVISFIERFDLASLDHWSDTQLIKLPVGDGLLLEINLGRIKPLVRLILQYGLRVAKQMDELILTRHQLLFMQEAELAMAATAARWQGTAELRQMLRKLVAPENQDLVDAPLGLKTTLRDYQYEGFNWLHRLRLSRFGGVLADDMGLGKTVQALALLQLEKEAGRLSKASLIIAPTSVIGNWYEESLRFTPELKVLIYHGNDRHHDQFDDYDLVISTYGLVQRDKRRLLEYNFYYLILDEAQFIKNTRTKTRQIIQQLHATHRLCLTGTPLENHLGELWSLFHFLTPGLLGDRKQFRQFFRNPIEKHQDQERREILVKRIQPFLLRRNKNEVARELPNKTEITQSIQLVGAQRDLYEAIRMSTEHEVRAAISKQGLGKSHLLLLDALLKLRQVCCDPRLLSLPGASMAHGCSAKLNACMELIDNLMDEGRSVLIFSQFTSMLSLIEHELNLRHYPYLKLTGKTQGRQALVQRFQSGEVPIFLISLKAGGTGLNLTQADTVIHYDPWWNPAVEDQATDRSHRIGQLKPVFVYRLISAGTVEETMVALQTKKRLLFNGILSNQVMGKTTDLTESDIASFFAPLS
jgi:superfamily II DNA or RNA helicase